MASDLDWLSQGRGRHVALHHGLDFLRDVAPAGLEAFDPLEILSRQRSHGLKFNDLALLVLLLVSIHLVEV